MIPGELIVGNNDIEINKDLSVIKIKILNKGDRPIQVGSHFHFFEVNKYLNFDRKVTFGYRLNIPSGTAVRFESNEEKEVELVQIAGKRIVRGLNNLTDGEVSSENLEKAIEIAKIKGFI